MIVSELLSQELYYNDKSFLYFANDTITTTATGDTTPEYDNTVQYLHGDYVKVSSVKRKFRCANVSGFIGKHPIDYLGIDWTDAGAINEFAMFDDSLSSATVSQNDFFTTMEIKGATTLTIQNLKNIANIRIVHKSADNSIIYSDTTYGRDIGRYSYYDYYTRPIKDIKKITTFLEWHGVSNIEISFTVETGGTSEVGFFGCGVAYDLGATLYGSSVGYEDYSIYKTDEFGFTTFDKRVAVDIINGKVLIDVKKTDYALDVLKSLRGKLSHFIGDEREKGEIKSLNIVGYVKNLTIPIDGPSKNEYPIKIIGGA